MSGYGSLIGDKTVSDVTQALFFFYFNMFISLKQYSLSIICMQVYSE